MIEYNHQPNFSVVIDSNIVYVYKYEKCKFDQPFLSFQPKHIFIDNSKVCVLTKFSRVVNNPDYNGSTILLECESNEYVFFSGSEIFRLKIDDKIFDYISLLAGDLRPYAFGIGEKNTFFLSDH